jgi:membrane-bound metal-dependent hydrolase YbcI (DUF457 family)
VTIQDFAHVYELRVMTHSLMFFLPFKLTLLFILYRLDIVLKKEILILIFVGSSHIIGDVLFGSYYPFFPIFADKTGLFGWGSYLNYSVEIIISFSMMIVLVHTKDYQFIKTNISDNSGETRIQSIYINVVLIVLTGVILAQIGGIFYLDFLNGPNFYNQVVYNDGGMLHLSLVFIAVNIIFVFILLNFIQSRFFGKTKKNP